MWLKLKGRAEVKEKLHYGTDKIYETHYVGISKIKSKLLSKLHIFQYLGFLPPPFQPPLCPGSLMSICTNRASAQNAMLQIHPRKSFLLLKPQLENHIFVRIFCGCMSHCYTLTTSFLLYLHACMHMYMCMCMHRQGLTI